MAQEMGAKETSPLILEIAAVLLLLFNMFLASVLKAREVTSASELFGAIFAVPLLTLVAVGIASLAEGMRNRRSRAKLILGLMVFFLLGQLGQFLEPARGSRRSRLHGPVTGAAQQADAADKGRVVCPLRLDSGAVV